MASNVIRGSLSTIVKRVNTFQSKPKENKGHILGEWFAVGEEVFQDFHQLGVVSNWSGSAIKLDPEFNQVVASVTKNQDWLQSFVAIYGSTRVDLEGGVPAGDICRVRSGIEFLCQGFCGASSTFNKVLENLRELGEVEEFDSRLKVWRDNGFRPDFFSGDLQPNTPKTHWWWY